MPQPEGEIETWGDSGIRRAPIVLCGHCQSVNIVILRGQRRHHQAKYHCDDCRSRVCSSCAGQLAAGIPCRGRYIDRAMKALDTQSPIELVTTR